MRIISDDGNVRGLACVTTNLVNEASRRNRALPTAAAALGRALTGAALLSALLKSGQRVALKFEGNGPLKKIVVEGDSNGAVRGYVEVPNVHLPPRHGKLDVASALGNAGILTVSKDLGLEEPHRGIVELYTSEIAADIAYYLAKSEQIPSAVGLGVFVEPDGCVSAAGGFLIQSLTPDEAIIGPLTEHIEKLPPVTELLRRGQTPEELLELIFAGIPFTSLEKRRLVLQCSCSRARVEKALLILGREELAALIAAEEPASVTCEFCRKRYVFSREELESLAKQM